MIAIAWHSECQFSFSHRMRFSLMVTYDLWLSIYVRKLFFNKPIYSEINYSCFRNSFFCRGFSTHLACFRNQVANFSMHIRILKSKQQNLENDKNYLHTHSLIHSCSFIWNNRVVTAVHTLYLLIIIYFILSYVLFSIFHCSFLFFFCFTLFFVSFI